MFSKSQRIGRTDLLSCAKLLLEKDKTEYIIKNSAYLEKWAYALFPAPTLALDSGKWIRTLPMTPGPPAPKSRTVSANT